MRSSMHALSSPCCSDIVSFTGMLLLNQSFDELHLNLIYIKHKTNKLNKKRQGVTIISEQGNLHAGMRLEKQWLSPLYPRMSKCPWQQCCCTKGRCSFVFNFTCNFWTFMDIWIHFWPWLNRVLLSLPVLKKKIRTAMLILLGKCCEADLNLLFIQHLPFIHFYLAIYQASLTSSSISHVHQVRKVNGSWVNGMGPHIIQVEERITHKKGLWKLYTHLADYWKSFDEVWNINLHQLCHHPDWYPSVNALLIMSNSEFEFWNIHSLHASSVHRSSGLQPRLTLSTPSCLFPHEKVHRPSSFVKCHKVCG